MVQPVLQGEDEGLWGHERPKGRRGGGRIVGLDAEEHEINRSHGVGLTDGGHTHDRFCVGRLYARAVALEGLQVRPARDEDDIFTRVGEPCPVIPSHGSSSENRDTHTMHSQGYADPGATPSHGRHGVA